MFNFWPFNIARLRREEAARTEAKKQQEEALQRNVKRAALRQAIRESKEYPTTPTLNSHRDYARETYDRLKREQAMARRAAEERRTDDFMSNPMHPANPVYQTIYSTPSSSSSDDCSRSSSDYGSSSSSSCDSSSSSSDSGSSSSCGCD